jgi:hypothetical protein
MMARSVRFMQEASIDTANHCLHRNILRIGLVVFIKCWRSCSSQLFCVAARLGEAQAR